jgi:hypothetical protein
MHEAVSDFSATLEYQVTANNAFGKEVVVHISVSSEARSTSAPRLTIAKDVLHALK